MPQPEQSTPWRGGRPKKATTEEQRRLAQAPRPAHAALPGSTIVRVAAVLAATLGSAARQDSLGRSLRPARATAAHADCEGATRPRRVLADRQRPSSPR